MPFRVRKPDRRYGRLGAAYGSVSPATPTLGRCPSTSPMLGQRQGHTRHWSRRRPRASDDRRVGLRQKLSQAGRAPARVQHPRTAFRTDTAEEIDLGGHASGLRRLREEHDIVAEVAQVASVARRHTDLVRRCGAGQPTRPATFAASAPRSVPNRAGTAARLKARSTDQNC